MEAPPEKQWIDGPDGQRWRVELKAPTGRAAIRGGSESPGEKMLWLHFKAADGNERWVRRSYGSTTNIRQFSVGELQAALTACLNESGAAEGDGE
jgi:hypothetical protein